MDVWRIQRRGGLLVPQLPSVGLCTNLYHKIYLSGPGSLAFQSVSSSGQDFLLPHLLGATCAASEGVTKGTTKTEATSWRRWCEFLQQAGLAAEPFLEPFSRQDKHRILGAVAQAIRAKLFSQSTKGKGHPIGKGTVSAHLGHVATAFTSHGRPSPKFDADGKPAFLLRRQLRAYQNSDPAVKHQEVLPFELIKRMVTRKHKEPILVVFHQLMLFGFFFAMRSCENVRVQGTERRTKSIMKRNLVFLKDDKILPHDHLFLETADSVTVNFEYQKRDDRNDQVTQCATEHPLFYPVKIAARIIRRLHAMRASDEIPISTFVRKNGRWGDFDSSTALILLRDFISDEGGGHLVCTARMSASTPFGRRQQWQCT
jgi:hypothetical protein